jgi:hypothetical protein
MSPSFCGQYRKVAYNLKSPWSCTNRNAGHTGPTARQPWLMSSPASCDHKVTYRAQTPEFRVWPHGPSLKSPWWPRSLKGVWRQLSKNTLGGQTLPHHCAQWWELVSQPNIWDLHFVPKHETQHSSFFHWDGVTQRFLWQGRHKNLVTLTSVSQIAGRDS